MLSTAATVLLDILVALPLVLLGVGCYLYPPNNPQRKMRLTYFWAGTFMLAIASIVYSLACLGWWNLMTLPILVTFTFVGTYSVYLRVMTGDPPDTTPREAWDPLGDDGEIARADALGEAPAPLPAPAEESDGT